MRGLSFTVPWPFVVLYLGKRLENRQRWPNCKYRGPIAIHASSPPGPVARWWKRAVADGYRADPTPPQAVALADFRELFRGCIDIAQQNGIDPGRSISRRELLAMTGHIVGVAEIVDTVFPSSFCGPDAGADLPVLSSTGKHPPSDQIRWWMGGFALVLDNVRPLAEPVACRGAQGLWRLPAPVERAVQRQIAA